MSETLPYLQANVRLSQLYIDTGRRHESPVSVSASDLLWFPLFHKSQEKGTEVSTGRCCTQWAGVIAEKPQA